MATGDDFGADEIPHFNGGLFDDAPPMDLTRDDLGILNLAANQDWSQIEPSILGTLFERSLDPSKRAQIGAHYTSKEDILLVVDPVIMQPLRKEWDSARAEIEQDLANLPTTCPLPVTKTSRSGKTSTRITGLTTIHQKLATFLAKISSLKILDPACGSGNFLYVAIQQLLSLEKEILAFGAHLPPPYTFNAAPRVRPTQLLGIEINPYAAELAQVSIWIGFLQWMYLNGFPPAADTPILSKLQSIDNRDAILDYNSDDQSRDRQGAVSPSKLPTPAQWPDAHFIIGNPPFLGSKLFRKNGLPNDYVAALYKAYDLPKTSDLCCYWFELARRKIESSNAPTGPAEIARGDQREPLEKIAPKIIKPQRGVRASSKNAPSETSNSQLSNLSSPFPTLSLPRCGLLATQAIRGGDNRTVLQRIKQSGDIFMAWSDKEWILDGAAVNVSIVGFSKEDPGERFLDAKVVQRINADLSSGFDKSLVQALQENNDLAFMGDTKGGDFDIDLKEARKLLASPNPNGTSNSEVVKPRINGHDVLDRPRGEYIIDFGVDMPIEVASQFEAPFAKVERDVRPERVKNRRESYAKLWWIHVEPRPSMRAATKKLQRFIFMTIHAKHRIFIWAKPPIVPDHAGFIFAREDDYFLGCLQNSIHILWAQRMGTQLEDRPRYTPSSCFENFPFPWPPGKEDTTHPAYTRIAAAAKELNDLRERWLNPPELLDPLARILDAQDDFSDVPPEARPLIRHSALMAEAAKSPNLKKRTLTNLYNERPTWLKLAHEKLDKAVLAAYAHIDPAGNWQEDWATLYTDTGAGAPLPPDHPRAAERAATDQKILANLLRLNHLRTA
ncbi:MAG TPA: DNA methyltransferase [Phycisphaerae bacterium]|nr:DNA methyltransferase [Phycisphaerae bacterium]